MSRGSGGGSRRRRVSVALRLAVTIGLLVLLVTRVEWRGVIATLRGLRPLPFAAGVALFLAAQLLSAAKWRWIARDLGCGASLWRHARLYFAGMFLSLFLPSLVGGDLFRATMLAGDRRRWLPDRFALWSVILERFTGLVGLWLLLCCGLIAAWLLDLAPLIGAVGAAAGGLLVAGLLLFAILPRTVAGRWMARRWPTASGLLSDDRLRQAVLAASVTVQLLYALVHLLLSRALGLEVAWASWLWIAPAVGFLASLPVSLGGVGPREWGYLYALAAVGLAREQGVAFGCTWLAMVTAISLAGGMALLPRFGGRSR